MIESYDSWRIKDNKSKNVDDENRKLYGFKIIKKWWRWK